MVFDNSCAGAEFPAILFVAGALGQPFILESGAVPGTGKATDAQVCDWWTTTGYGYFLSIRPFVRYGPRRHLYVYDATADRENRYLRPDEQDPVCASTPLPEWDNKVVPGPPRIEK